MKDTSKVMWPRYSLCCAGRVCY